MPDRAKQESTGDPGEFRIRPKRGALRPRSGNAQEQRMVEVAAQIFYERGYDATSIQEIADRLGLLKGSLYHYISSKEDILWTIILRQHQTALALAERIREMDASPDVRLRQFIEGYTESLEKDHVFVSIYLHDMNRLSPERREKIVSERQEYTNLVMELLAEGKRAKVFRGDLDPYLSSQALLGMMNSAYRWYRPGGSTSAGQVTGECLKLILSGVLRAG
jgi:TetR/AcrR family transcriptional regulator, cholesterol catabolism regulator